MNSADLIALSPLVLLGVTPLAILVAIAVRRHHDLCFGIAVGGLVAALLSLYPASSRRLGEAPATAGELLRADGLAHAGAALLIAATLIATLLARPYLARLTDRPEEYYALSALAALGAAALAFTDHLAGLFLGVETMSVALYGLIAFSRHRAVSIEAALKYLIMTGAASAVLLFGAALLYADTGGLSFAAIAESANTTGFGPTGLAGLALLIAAVATKLALVPFHMWSPDVYQGAPAPAAALIATVSKGAVVIVSFRMLASTGALDHPAPAAMLASLAVASMIAGNLLALLQTRIKRLFAYSSIAHLGYLLVAVLAAGSFGLEAFYVYLAAYFATMLLAFGVVTALCTRHDDADELFAFSGLCVRRPLLGICLVLALLSLVGLPLTGGFIAKLYVLAAGASAERWGLVIAVAGTSVLAAFYYLRLIMLTLARPSSAELASYELGTRTTVYMGVVLVALAIAVVVLGVAPYLLEPLVSLAQRSN